MLRQTPDFSLRDHGPNRVWVVVGVLVVVAVSVVLLDIVLAESELNQAFHLVVAVCLAGFMLFIYFRLYYRLSLAEFMNLVYSSALKSDTLFCVICKANKNIVYCDDLYRQFVGDRDLDSIESLLAHDALAGPDATEVNRAIDVKRSAEVAIAWTDQRGETVRGVLVVNPLRRPYGYSVLRAYAEEQSASPEHDAR